MMKFVGQQNQNRRTIIGCHVIASTVGGPGIGGNHLGQYVDIVDGATPLSQWINSVMLDQAVLPPTQPTGNFHGHTSNWLNHHFDTNPLSAWRGQVDYIGKCKNPFADKLDDKNGRTATPAEVELCRAQTGFANDLEADCDCDHWFDNTHDNCPHWYNPEQTWTNEQTQLDPNGKAIGDACLRCPCDPDNDADADGYCAVLCPWQAGVVDNCPFVPNADQVNSNVDFEIANGQSILGDACDPVPTPVPRPSFHLVPAPNQCNLTMVCTNPTSLSPNCGPGCALNIGCDTCQCCATAITDYIATTTVGSHARSDGPLATVSLEHDAQVPSTSTRFCQEATTPVPFQCHGYSDPSGSNADTNHVLNDNQLSVPEPAILAAANPWHKVTTTGTATLSQVKFDYTAPSLFYGNPLSDFARVWLYQNDLNTWLTNPSQPIIPACASTNPTCLSGIWWNSGATDIGKGTNLDGTGIHIEGPMTGNIADSIAPITPVGSLIGYCPIPTPKFNLDPPPLTGPIGWGPGRIGVLPHAVSYQLDGTALPLDSRVLVASTTGNVVAALQSDGSAISAENIGQTDCGGNQVDGTLHTTLFGATLSWFGAIEPSNAIIGLPFDAMALSIDGTRVVGVAQTVDGALTTTPGANPFGDPPAPRGGYAAVYSRWAGGIFVAGGQALADSSVLHDIWLGRSDGSWNDVTPHAAGGTSCPLCGAVRDIGVIQALTYSFADKKLWLIDELPAKPFTLTRLMRASPGGAIEQIAIWVKAGLAQDYFLSVDHDGAILATFARAKGQGFVVARLEVDGVGLAHATATYANVSDKLLAPPFVSPVGYTYLIQHAKQLPSLLRSPHLDGLEHSKPFNESLCQ